GLAELAERFSRQRLVAALACAALLGCMFRSWVQVSYWHDSLALWQHSLEVTGPNARTLFSLAVALEKDQRWEEALARYEEALKLDPNDAKVHNNLGALWTKLRNLPKAIDHCRTAVEIDPEYAQAHYNFGVALEMTGNVEGAILE